MELLSSSVLSRLLYCHVHLCMFCLRGQWRVRCEKRSPILQFCELRDAEKNRLTEPSVCVFYFLWNLVTLKIGENKIGGCRVAVAGIGCCGLWVEPPLEYRTAPLQVAWPMKNALWEAFADSTILRVGRSPSGKVDTAMTTMHEESHVRVGSKAVTLARGGRDCAWTIFWSKNKES